MIKGCLFGMPRQGRNYAGIRVNDRSTQLHLLPMVSIYLLLEKNMLNIGNSLQREISSKWKSNPISTRLMAKELNLENNSQKTSWTFNAKERIL